MTRREQQVGKQGEALALSALRSIGVEQIEHIGTPVRLIASGKNDGTFRVVYGEPVAADFRGVLPKQVYYDEDEPSIIAGVSVMAEVKTILDRNLRYSDLRPHQPGKLTEHSDLGGISLLVWVHSSGVYVMRWPIPGFSPGFGIIPFRADQIKIN